MAKPTDVYERVASAFNATVDSIGDDQWQLPTPCHDWDVTALVSHVVKTHRNIYGMVSDEGSVDFDENAPVVTQWRVASSALQRALANPSLASKPVETRMGPSTFEKLVSELLMYDTLCHSWDLARAVGANEELDPEAVQLTYDALVAMGDTIRVPGGFGPALEPPPGADLQTRYLYFAGRKA